MTRIGNATLTVPLGTDSIPIARANDTTARRALISNLSQPAYYVEAYGISPGNSSAVNTAAFDALVALIAGSGVEGSTIQFGKGTYLGNFNISGKNGFTIRGTSKRSTVLAASSGIVLDITSANYCVIENLMIDARNGSALGILAGRYAAWGSFSGVFDTLRDIFVNSYASIAGIWICGMEVSGLYSVVVIQNNSAPALYVSKNNVYGDSNLTYTSPNGTLGGTSQNILQIFGGEFVNESTGTAVEMGPESANIHFTGVFFHAMDSDIVRFDNHAIASQWVNIVFNHCHWEGDKIDAAVYGKRTGSLGTPSVHRLSLNDCTFAYYRDPNDAGQADIDFSDTNYYLYNADIRNVNCYAGGGYEFGRIYNSYLEYKPYSVAITAAITAGATTFQVAASVITNGLIKADDFIVLGRGQGNDADTSYTNPERRKVQSVSGTTVTVTVAFTYDHPTIGDLLWVGLPQIYIGRGNQLLTFGYPEFTGEDTGNHVVVTSEVGGNTRMYYGPGPLSASRKGAPVIVNRPFAAAPGNPEIGMLAYADGATWNPGSTGEGLYVYTSGGWVKL